MNGKGKPTAEASQGASLLKQHRADNANRLIDVIANCGRQFLRHDDVIAKFSVDGRGRVWFTDAYTGKPIYTHDQRGPWRGFTCGGTMRTLIEWLAIYIRTGQPQRLNLGPWPQWICGGDLWGYGVDMQLVRDAAKDLGILSTDAGLNSGPGE